MDTKDMTTRDAEFHTELFGENTYIFSPEDDPGQVAQTLDAIYEKQEADQFGEARYAIYFMPGEYDETIEADVGFYTQVAGLGELPTDTKLQSLQCTARWLSDDPSNHNACCNFWRGVENIELKTNTMWAVSQATFMRRVQVDGALFLHDEYGWCSGGFLADSNTDLMTDSGSQQQWLSRNCNWKAWMGANWNMVFVGTEEGKNPTGTWPVVPYTEVEKTEAMQEKPFLIYDDEEGYMVYVPKERENAIGVSWEDHGQVVRSVASGEGFRAGRQVPEFIETACVLGDVFVRQLVRHHEVHEGPALGLVRGVVKVKGFRAVGGGRNAQQQKDSVQAPDARQRAPRGLLAQGTAAPVNGQVNEGRQQQGPGGGGGGAEGAGFPEVGLRHAGKDGEVQRQPVPHLHHVQARVEQDDGRKDDVGGKAVFQAEKDGAAEQGGGTGDAHAAHQHALAVIEHIRIDHQSRRESGCPQAAHAARKERGAKSLEDGGKSAWPACVPFCGTGGCMGRGHRKERIKYSSCLKG